MAQSLNNSSSSPIPTTVDVLVVGGGPGGAAAALQLRHRADCSVLLVDASDYQEFRVGESIPPTVGALLAEYDADALLNDKKTALPCFGTESAWETDELEFRDYLTGMAGNGWHLDRSRFDAGVAAIAKNAGVMLRTNTRTEDVEQLPDETWRVTLRDSNQTYHTVEAKFLVDATGRRVAVARKLGARWQKFDNLIAVVSRFQVDESVPRRVTIEACPSGWWYTAPVPGNTIIVAWLSDADLVKDEGMHRPQAWELALRKTRYTQQQIASAKQEETRPHTYAAGSWLLEPAHGANWVAVGDASSCFDPLSSVGVTEALRSGIACGGAIEAWLNGDHSVLSTHFDERRLEFEHYLVERDRIYSSAERFRDAPFWQRRRGGTIHMNPQALVCVPSGGASALQRAVGSKLTTKERSIVANLCKESHHAHEIVTELIRAGNWQHADRRLVLGVQDLVERGLLASA